MRSGYGRNEDSVANLLHVSSEQKMSQVFKTSVIVEEEK